MQLQLMQLHYSTARSGEVKQVLATGAGVIDFETARRRRKRA